MLIGKVEFGWEIRNRIKVTVFQTIEGKFGGKCGGKASKIHNPGRKHRTKLIFGSMIAGFMLIGKVEFSPEIRTRTKVTVFQTIGGNVGEKLLRSISLEGNVGQS